MIIAREARFVPKLTSVGRSRSASGVIGLQRGKPWVPYVPYLTFLTGTLQSDGKFHAFTPRGVSVSDMGVMRPIKVTIRIPLALSIRNKPEISASGS
jgi:hypothetical protein